jgi:hypothetical protein
MKLSILATFFVTLCLAAPWAEAQSHGLQEGATGATTSNVKRHLRKKNKDKQTKKLDESSLTECPLVGPLTDCAIGIDPVLCGTTLQCYYDNPCNAWGAGWNVAKQCVATAPRTDP